MRRSCIRFGSLDGVDTEELFAVVRDGVAATAEGRDAVVAV